MAGTAPHTRWLVAAFALVMACFLGATLYSQERAREISELSTSISGNAMPSIEHLASARTELRHMQLLAAEYIGQHDSPAGPGERARESPLTGLLDAQKKVDLEVDAYLRLPVYPGEETVWRDVSAALSEVDADIAMVRAYAEIHDLAHAAGAAEKLSAACDHATAASLDVIEFNARNGEQIARRIDEVRALSLRVALGLDAVSVAMTVLVALLAVRVITGHERLLRRHNELLAQRADELEQFAGRVAHDIRNPLGSVMVCLQLVRRRLGDQDKKITEPIARGESNLQRALRILDGLLAFASAGARPAEDARADASAVIGALVSDLRHAAEQAQIELRCEPLPEGSVRCDPSILEVLVSNLVRNALKYMGEGPERRVTVRGYDTGPALRIEVQDTGIGVPKEAQRTIFEPFVRGPAHGQPGIGLGLATVKRICDTHGGRAGVESPAEGGSRFWFELPKVDVRPAG